MPTEGASDMNRTSAAVARLTVTLRGIRPLVWRRLEVPIAFSFAELSAVILTAFGWTGRHRHDFLLVDCRIGVPHRETPHDTPLAIDGLADLLGQLAPELASLVPTPPFEDERNVTLAREIERGRLRFLYHYDFADDWRHLVEVDDVAVAEPDIAYPRCLGGCRAAPPEGCGGSAGYEHFCRVLGDPHHDEFAKLRAWCPDFAPEWFDLASTDHAVRAFPNRRAGRS